MYQFRKIFLRLFQTVALAWETVWEVLWLITLALVYLALYPVVVGVFTGMFYASLMLGRAHWTNKPMMTRKRANTTSSGLAASLRSARQPLTLTVRQVNNG